MANSPPYQNLNEGNGSFLQGRRYMTILIRRSTDVIGNPVNTSVVDRLLSSLHAQFVSRFNNSTIKTRLAESIFPSSQLLKEWKRNDVAQHYCS